MKHQTAFTASHHEAAKVGQQILDAGGTASEAMVAAAAMIAVQYPHMNGIGGDGFWLIAKKGQTPIAIDGCGAAAINIDVDGYRNQNDELPESGGEAAITMAGTVSGWHKALKIDAGDMSLQTLLEPAIEAARSGITVTQSLVNASEKTFSRLSELKAFSEIFLPEQRTLQVGDVVRNPALANTLQTLANNGLDDFYRGELAASMARELEAQGSPLRLEDFHQHHAKVMTPLSITTSKGKLYNFDAPTQGVASLLILAIYDKLISQTKPSAAQLSELDHIHLLVEATKQAFIIRDQVVCDEDDLSQPLRDWLTDDVVERCAKDISLEQAKPWPHQAKPGDTIWMGASDQYGTMVSFIQSVYWEFGCGLVLPETGVLWNVRGKSFSLSPGHHNVLAPRKKPFHTLNPAYAELNDGSRMSYGTMGGEGQPQTQACLFSRFYYQGKGLEESVAMPRWLLGRTWGDSTNNLRLERSLYQQFGQALGARGHDVTYVEDNNELMGHAGAIVLDTQGNASATNDPRSDGTYLLGEHND